MAKIDMETYRNEHRTGSVQTVDVRSAAEYAAGHIPGAVNVPLEQVPVRGDDISRDRPLVLVCQSGHRAAMAARALASSHPHAKVLEGSTAAWIAAGYPVVRAASSSWSLDRQVRLLAGLLILATLGLGFMFSAKWLLATAFIGAGLTFAGATGICGMGLLLAAMPWNRRAAAAAACQPAGQ